MNMREQLTERVGKPHLSYSSMKYALGDMRLWEMYMRGQLKKESDALQFGSLYDMMLFEPEKARDTYFVLDDTYIVERMAKNGAKNPRITKKYRDWKAEQQELNQGKTIASQEDWRRAEEMIQRLKDCGLYDKRFAGGKFQVEFNVDLDGIPLKGFLDCLQDDCIIDSKSSRAIDKFRYDVNSWSYDIQAYIYTKVFGIKDFYWVVQEKTYPYLPALVKCTEETLFTGEMKFNDALRRIRQFLNEDYDPTKDYLQYEV